MLRPPASPVGWPPPPDPPRIKYLGQIRTSADLRPAKTGWRRLRETLNRTEYRPIPLTAPLAVACGDDGHVYVADPGSASLHVLDLVGRTHRRVTSAGEAALRSPAGVAGGKSSVFVTDSVLGDVLGYRFGGDYPRRLGLARHEPWCAPGAVGARAPSVLAAGAKRLAPRQALAPMSRIRRSARGPRSRLEGNALSSRGGDTPAGQLMLQGGSHAS